MDCPHCDKSIHPGFYESRIFLDNTTPSNWNAQAMLCPSCGKHIINLKVRSSNARFNSPSSFIAVPRTITSQKAPVEVPQAIAEDYREAREVLSVSPKASAALSRRCLQSVLDQHGYKAKSLAKQIDAVLAETDARKALPTVLLDTIDLIRNFGNFSAHPIDDKATNQIIPVEEHEAEFCLEILVEMFDHFYVKPEKAKQRKAALNAKLAAAGKPPSK